MANEARDWMTAASCAEGPPPSVRFADLPRQDQGEVLRVALVAAASTAYFITLAILARPLASRSLQGDAALPHPGMARSPILDARLVDDPVPPAGDRTRLARPRAGLELTSLREPVADEPASAPIADTPPRRRNVFSRFFRGVLHGFQPPAKTDPF